MYTARYIHTYLNLATCSGYCYLGGKDQQSSVLSGELPGRCTGQLTGSYLKVLFTLPPTFAGLPPGSAGLP